MPQHHRNCYCKVICKTTLMMSIVLVIVCWCVGVVSFPLPISLKKENQLTLRGRLLKQLRDSHGSDPYKLGLTPYIPKIPNSEMQESTAYSIIQHDNNQTFRLNLTSPEPLSYLHLLQYPDSVQTLVRQNDTRTKTLSKPLFIDDWMMQLPSKWAAFVSEGDTKDVNIISSIFSLPLSAQNIGASRDVRISNMNVTKSSEEGSIGADTFNTSNNVDAIWDRKNTTQKKNSQNDILVQNKSKMAKLSTQPQSVFTNNFNDLRKNTTTRTLQTSTSKPFYIHPLLAGKDPSAAITVADLEAILRYNDYYSRSSSPLSTEKELQLHGVSSASTKTNKGGIAFPQPTTLSNRSIKWGATVSGGLMGMLLAVSGAPNLWLMGSLAGSVFGYETSKRLPLNDETLNDFNVMQSLVIHSGRYLATIALRIYDTFQAFFFMYKTGQLSYEYYKSYALLDKRLSIQKKIDAWNARFVEGKLAFDRWEKENEVSRKVLAGLRTVWLVGEQNVRKRSGLLRRSQRYQSRYRVIQFVYDAIYTIGKLCESFWTLIVRGDICSEMKNFVIGIIRNDMGNLTFTQSHIRGVFLSVAMVIIIGALFTVSPVLLFLVAATFGLIWPTWVSEMLDRTGIVIDETVARGRGKISKIKTKDHDKLFLKRYEKNRYHYYRTADGKKRYYRVGEPWIISQFYKNILPAKKVGPFAWIFNTNSSY